MFKRSISLLLAALLIVMSMGLPVGAEEDLPEAGSPENHPVRSFRVDVTTVGNGTGLVEGAGLYARGAVATMSAIAAPDSTFVKWERKIHGDWLYRGTANPYTTSPIGEDRTYRATFDLKPVDALTVSFDQAGSVPGGTFKWIIHNPNKFNVLYTWQLSTSGGTIKNGGGPLVAAEGDNVLLLDCVDKGIQRIDTLKIAWGYGSAYRPLPVGSEAELAGPCPPERPGASASSVEWFILTTAAEMPWQGTVLNDDADVPVMPFANFWTGAVVPLLASPAPQSSFDKWSGDLTGNANPSSLTMDADKRVTAHFHYGIGFQKLIRLPMSDETALPGDGQFTFRLQALEEAGDGPSRLELQFPPVPYDQTASNDAAGWVQFWSNPDGRMFLTPGYYLLTEEPEAGYEPCTIPENGLVLWLMWNGRFRVLGEFNPPSVSAMMASPSEEGPDYCGPQGPFIVYNCEIPAPALAVDKKANGVDGPIDVSTGSTVNYTIRVTNTGNVTISAITLEDDMSPDMPYGPFDLGPEAYKDFSYQKTFPLAGTYVNTATAAGFTLIRREIGDEQVNGVARTPLETLAPDVGPVTDTVTVRVTAPPTPSPSPSPSPTPGTNVALTVVIEGPGTALPGSGAYGLNSVVQMTVTPGDGATFVGWFGPNGAEVADNRITMNTDKSIIARFEVPAPPQASPVPQAAPVVVEEPVILPEIIPETPPIVMPLEEEVPQAAPALPKTGGVPGALLTMLGAVLAGAGFGRKRRDRKS